MITNDEIQNLEDNPAECEHCGCYGAGPCCYCGALEEVKSMMTNEQKNKLFNAIKIFVEESCSYTIADYEARQDGLDGTGYTYAIRTNRDEAERRLWRTIYEL